MDKLQGEKYFAQLMKEKEIEGIDKVKEGIGVPASWCDKDKSHFCCPSGNDHMSGIGVSKGDLLAFEVTDTLESGDIGLFFVKENKCVCRIYRVYDAGIFLLATNPSIEPYKVESDDKDFRIAGKLVAILKDMRNKKAE